ncbi:MAG: tRNA pseudouridine synthase B [Owenweeksia sp. TMED14]|nr:MAG: tRNA pseudouridine synthase B [Owenweeksia sp. TMED14]
MIPHNVDSLHSGWVFSVDKPLGWTSFDVVAKLRNTIRIRYGVKVKIGHAGTLDPLASGVLVICAGKATKTINDWVETPKKYRATLSFGATTESYDSETKINSTGIPVPLFTKEISTLIESSFLGTISQVPPIYSAVKVNGKRAYKHARNGILVEMPERKVTIHSLEWISTIGNSWEVEVSCSKGTYIRSLANDIGQFLGCGAYLSSLIRTAVGSHLLADSKSLDEWITLLGGD